VTRRWLWLATAIVLISSAASAQTGPYGSIGVVIGQGYEANIFAVPVSLGRQDSDLVTRLGPVVEAGYRSEPFRLIGRYEINAERFWDHRELDRRVARQDGAVEFIYRAARHVELAGAAFYTDTYSPLELASPDSIVLGRVHAERLTIQPNLLVEVTSGSRLRIDYEGAREALADGPPSLVHTVTASVIRTADLRTSYNFDYRIKRFGSPGTDAEQSHVVMGGWTRNIARFAEIEVNAGPRLFAGSVRPEIAAALRRSLRRTELSLEFAESETSVLGERGIVAVRRLRAAAIIEAGRNFTLTAAPMVFRNARDNRSATVMGMDLEALAQLARGVSFTLLGQVGRQDGDMSGTFERIPYYSVSTALRIVFPGNPRNVPDEQSRRREQRERSRRNGESAR
jgi:hypothetical protein